MSCVFLRTLFLFSSLILFGDSRPRVPWVRGDITNGCSSSGIKTIPKTTLKLLSDSTVWRQNRVCSEKTISVYIVHIDTVYAIFAKMSFNVQSFLSAFKSDPRVETLEQLKKSQMLEVATELRILVKPGWRKAEIVQAIVGFLVKEKVLPEEAYKECIVKEQMADPIAIELARLRLDQLKLEIKLKESETRRSPNVGQPDLNNLKLVPHFDEEHIDRFFLHFEKIATQCSWPRQHWVLFVQSSLKGKAQEIYASLSVDQCSDYNTVKEAILKAYELVPEAYRQKFRNLRKKEGQTFVEFAREKEILFERWCESSRSKSYNDLKQLVLVEEFKRSCNSDLHVYLDERGVKTLSDAASIAEDYVLTHKRFKFKGQGQTQGQFQGREKDGKSQRHDFSQKSTDGNRSPSSGRKFTKFCKFCKKPGHLYEDCFIRLRKVKPVNVVRVNETDSSSDSEIEVTEPKSVALTSIAENRLCAPVETTQTKGIELGPISNMFTPFVNKAKVKLSSGVCLSIDMLRDTASAQSLVLSCVLGQDKGSYTGRSVLLKGVGGYRKVPLHLIEIESDIVSGKVVVGVVDNLPIEGIHFLLGNDLAGGVVACQPTVVDIPSETDEIGQSDLFPSCVITRSQKVKLNESESQFDLDLGSSFLTKDEGLVKPSLSKSSLIAEQRNDPRLNKVRDLAIQESEIDDVSVCYYWKGDVLMRKWQAPDVSANERWSVVHQIVVPEVYKGEILRLSHDIPVAGHLGINKTLSRILRHFYWPGVRSDVALYCKSCHSCQKVGKPNQFIPKAPLIPVPAFEEPFSRVICDCVGPLPKTRSGHEYMLTIMCASSRFPEAIPLRKITAKAVVKALVKFFTLVGIPKIVQTDQGTNFMSSIFQQVLQELGIQTCNSSAYHPESQGALERFHQTLKNMLKIYCEEHERDWDEGVPMVLFAAREVVQESLGFSPFELVFGHEVRGPLKLLKERLLDECPESNNVLQYVEDFRQRLFEAGELAKMHLKGAQKSMKAWYDRKAEVRTFKVGDEVLVLLPIVGDPMKAKYHGPYKVLKKVSSVNYVVSTPDRRKPEQLCHVNMLKAYHSRLVASDSKSEEKVCSCLYPDEECPELIEDEQEFDYDVGCQMRLDNTSVINDLHRQKMEHLSERKRKDIEGLIKDFPMLFGDKLTQTDIIYHDVDVGGTAPIKQHPYRVNPVKREKLKAEVEYMLKNEIIEAGYSDWSSPCLLVPKPDGSNRFCTDYRKVNKVTKTDTFPIPRMEDCIDRVGKAKYVSKFDLLKGYWQVPLTPRAVEVSSFVTPDGLYSYKVMPFGMKNSGATFQRMMNSVIVELEGVDVYIDDLIVYSETWADHVKRLRALFQRLDRAKLKINLAKSYFAQASVTYLGHVVGGGQVKPIEAKVKSIVDFPVPDDKKSLRRFLGVAGYYRKFCENFSTVVLPLTNLMCKNTKFVWTKECQEAFDQVKAILISSPVLMLPDYSKQFVLTVDASYGGAGAVLQQEGDDGILHPVSYWSKKYNKHEKNYSTVEKEALALICALQHYDVYLSGASDIKVFTDHNPLVFIAKMKNKNQKILRWSLFLQRYNLNIVHIKGSDNVIADALSRSY